METIVKNLYNYKSYKDLINLLQDFEYLLKGKAEMNKFNLNFLRNKIYFFKNNKIERLKKINDKVRKEFLLNTTIERL